MHEWGKPDLMRERRGDARTNWAVVCDPNDGIGMKYADGPGAQPVSIFCILGRVDKAVLLSALS